MGDFYTFASGSPFLTFFLAVGICSVLKIIISRGYRTIMVVSRGWPPAHLDADGDWKPEPVVDEDDE